LTFAKDIEISNAFIRLAPPFAQVTAGFLEIKSNYKKEIKIIKVKSNFSNDTELHDMKMENSKMSMFALDFVKIPAKSSVTFKKGSKHIMFIGLKNKLKEGEIKKVKFFFDNGENIDVKMKVKKF
jgi:copper(I)-binding protein